jgi:hypothetical protein
MGAHKTYGEFRGAKEIMEMLDLDPEENADAKTLDIFKALVWGVGRAVVTQREAGSQESSSVAAGPTAEVEMLRAEVNGLNADVGRLTTQVGHLTTQVEANVDAQAATLEALKQQNSLLVAKLDPERRKEMETRIGTKPTQGGAHSPAAASFWGNKKDKNKTNSSSKYGPPRPPTRARIVNKWFLFALQFVCFLLRTSRSRAALHFPLSFSLFDCPTFVMVFGLRMFPKCYYRVVKLSERMDDDETSRVFSNWGQLSKTISSKIKK